MQDDPSIEPRVVLREADATVLLLLTLPDYQRPWAVRELALEVGSTLEVEDALSRLRGAGLVHRCGEYTWPTRAAVMAGEVG